MRMFFLLVKPNAGLCEVTAMEHQQVGSLIFEELKNKLERHEGIAIFAQNRAKFEG